MTKIEGVVGTTSQYTGYITLDNCKFTLTEGHLTIQGKGIKLLNGSAIEVNQDAIIDVIETPVTAS